MAAGDVVEYSWVAEGGRINFDLHAHGDGQSVDYDRAAARPTAQAASRRRSPANTAGSGATATTLT